MGKASSIREAGDDVALEELVFSCSVCAATVSDVYKTSGSNKGFHSGSGDDDGLVTKLWIATCSHVTCGKHLEGAAAPFHPKGSQPRASCPKCMQSNKDHSEKELFAIKGVGNGEIDPAIPSEWRDCPAIKLDSSIPGMEAVRFQYMALVNFGQKTRQNFLDATRKLHAMEAACSRERKQRRQLQSDILDLQTQLERMRGVEKKLQQWEARKPTIHHYLGIFGEIMKEIHDNRTALRDLGYRVSNKSYGFPGDEVTRQEKAVEADLTDFAHPKANPRSATTVAARESGASSSARKRKREPEHYFDHEIPHVPASSRSLMPPPLPQALPIPKAVYQLQQSESQAASSASQHFHHPSQSNQALPYRPPPVPLTANLIQRPENGRQEHNEHWPAYDLSQHQPYHTIDSSTHPEPSSNHVSAIAHAQAPSFAFPTAYDAQPQTHQASRQMADTLDHNHVRREWPMRGFSADELHNNTQPAASVTPQRSNQANFGAYTGRRPFFNAEQGQARPDPMRPPSRGFPFNQQHTIWQRHTALRPRLSTSSAIANRLLSSTEHVQSDPSQMHAPHSQHMFNPPQTPQVHQPFFRRPDRLLAPSAMSQATSRPQTNSLRSHISLPPKNGRSWPTHGGEDSALSRIQGVRGLTSRHGGSAVLGPSPAFGAHRELFSAAGARRSVRR